MGSLLTEGTAGAIFEIMEAPVVSVERRKVQGIVFADPGSNMNLITHELAQQLQLEGGLTKIFMNRENEDYSEREAEDAKRRMIRDQRQPKTHRQTCHPRKDSSAGLLSTSYKLGKGRTGRARSASRCVGKNLEKFPRGRGRHHTTTIKNGTQKSSHTKQDKGSPKPSREGRRRREKNVRLL